MSHIVEDPHDKKGINKKNRFHQEMFNFLRLRRLDEKRIQDMETARKPKPEIKEEEVGDKVNAIRNRLTNKQRLSKERWNRFAGTSGGGGRGL